jgi:anaerobic C4-dicarboxylate transporter DcuA
MSIATIASHQAITASPVSAATAAMIGLLATHNIFLVQVLLICVPSTLIAVFVVALLQLRIGKELRDDPEYQNRLASGEIGSVGAAVQGASTPLAWALSKKAKSKLSTACMAAPCGSPR